MVIIGSWGRYYAPYWADNFKYILIPTSIVAIFEPALTDGVGKVATQWFHDDERALATNIGSLANALGTLMGFGLVNIYVHDSDRHDSKLGR